MSGLELILKASQAYGITAGVFQTLLFSIAVFAIKKYIEESSAKKVAEFKLELDKRLTDYQERFEKDKIELRAQSDLTKAKIENELGIYKSKVDGLHSERQLIIRKLYAKFAISKVSTERLLTHLKSFMVAADEDSGVVVKQLHRKQVLEAEENLQKLINYFLIHKLYFPPSLSVKINEWCDLSKDCIIKYDVNYKYLTPEYASLNTGFYEAYENSISTFNTEGNLILEEIEKSLRIMLGVDVNK